MSVEEIQDRIVKHCQDYWEKYERILLLSNLGGILEADDMALIKEQGSNLRQFIEVNLSSKVTIQRQDRGSPVIGIVPIDAKLPDDISEIFRPPTHSVPSRQYLSFQSDVWLAFSNSLPEGQKRWLILEDPIKIVDQTEPPLSDHATYEIDIPSFNRSDTPGKEFAIAIKEWAEINKIPLDRITRDRPLAKSNYSYRDSNLLDELFKKLNSNDLSRVSMPLDIVEKLYGIKRK